MVQRFTHSIALRLKRAQLLLLALGLLPPSRGPALTAQVHVLHLSRDAALLSALAALLWLVVLIVLILVLILIAVVIITVILPVIIGGRRGGGRGRGGGGVVERPLF